jgi:hypothetical protein
LDAFAECIKWNLIYTEIPSMKLYLLIIRFMKFMEYWECTKFVIFLLGIGT